MNGYLNKFDIQIDTLSHVYYELIKDIEEKSSLKDWWVFGGGTALSIFYFDHRKSFDIDIFITEIQVFDFLDPKWFIDESEFFDSSVYRFDQANKHLKLKTKDGIKVDFLLNERVINRPLKDTVLNLGFELYYESIEDIISKKIKFRKEDNLARDIFDLAVAIENDSQILNNLKLLKAISAKDLIILKKSLEKLDEKVYKLEIEKIEPSKKYIDTASNAKEIILKNIEI